MVAPVVEARGIRERRLAQAEHAGAGVHPADERRHRPAAHVGERVGRVVARDHQQALHQLADCDVLVRLQVDAGLPDPQPRFPDRDRVDSSFGRGANATAVISLVRLAIGSSRCGRRAHTTRPVFGVDHDAAADVDALTLAAAACDPSRGGSAAAFLARGLGVSLPAERGERLGAGGTTAPSVSVLAGPAWAVCPLAWSAPRLRRRRRPAARPPSAAGLARDGNATGEAARRRRAGQTSVQ